MDGWNLEVEKSKKYGHFVDGRKSSEAGAGVGTNFLILGFRVRISEGAPDFPRRVVFVALTFLDVKRRTSCLWPNFGISPSEQETIRDIANVARESELRYAAGFGPATLGL